MPGLFMQDRATNSRSATAQISLPLARLIRRRSNRRLSRRSNGRRRLDVIQNPRASFAMINLLIPSPPHFLKHMRPHAHPAGPALLLAHLSQRRPAMLARNAVIMIQQILRHSRNRSSPFRLKRHAIFLSNRALRFNLRLLALGNFLDFLQNFLGGLNTLIVFLAGHHLLEQAVFSVGGLGIGIGSFVLKSLERVVRFYLIGLIPVFAAFLFPLLDVQLVSLAIFQRGQMSSLRRLQLKSRRRYARIHLAKFFGNSRKTPAHIRKPNIHSLQRKKMLKDRYHETGILTQAIAANPVARAACRRFLTFVRLSL